MEQINWQTYWDEYLANKYGKEKVETEDDLYFQVARTINKKPVEKHVFDKIIEQIVKDLSFSANDVLVDLCCGNGLFTFELKDKVKKIIGVDFSENIIDAANEYRSAANITYCVGGVVSYLKEFKKHWPGVAPDKYLMNDSLAYFTPSDLEGMLLAIMNVSVDFKFLIRGVPDEALKWNYYNTEERKQVYHANIAAGDYTNGGLGNWWNASDIADLCTRLNLQFAIRRQDLEISDYRMDIIIARNYDV